MYIIYLNSKHATLLRYVNMPISWEFKSCFLYVHFSSHEKHEN